MAADAAEQVWSETLSTLRGVYPWIGVVFLVRLIAVVRAMFADVYDEELAAAVSQAYRNKRAYQNSEGLFLVSVPEALAAMRHAPKPVGVSPGIPTGGIEALISSVLVAARARGAPLAPVLAEIENLSDRARHTNDPDKLERLDRDMEEIEGRLSELGAGCLTEDERSKVSELVAREVAHYENQCRRGPLPVSEIDRLRRQCERNFILSTLKIPRLGMLYV
jgi:hypothetical protein